MNLDDQKMFKELDKDRVNDSIAQLPDQIKHVLASSKLIKIPKEYANVENVVISGMGGSNLGARIIQSALSDQIKIPLLITPGYSVPKFVGKNTLYIFSSYSGTTEEPLNCYAEVKKRGAKMMGITATGKNNPLEKLMLANNLPGFIFSPDFNPCKQPRLALGYSIFGTMVLLAKAGIFKIQVSQIEKIIAQLEIETRRLRPEAKQKANKAKIIAAKLEGKMPILVGAEHLVGNLHALRNQINESSKTFSAYLEVPELNHYAMEGLLNPRNAKDDLFFIFFESALFNPRNQKRLALTKQVVEKNGYKTITHKLVSSDRLSQAFELLQFGSWISYYLGMIYQVNPATVPWVDWFKKQLG